MIEPPNFHTHVHFSMIINNLGKYSARDGTHQITIKSLFSALNQWNFLFMEFYCPLID